MSLRADRRSLSASAASTSGRRCRSSDGRPAGIAGGAYDCARQYATERVAFGKTLAQQQAQRIFGRHSGLHGAFQI